MEGYIQHPDDRHDSIVFDHDRVVWDPDYRRAIIEQLKHKDEVQRRSRERAGVDQIYN